MMTTRKYLTFTARFNKINTLNIMFYNICLSSIKIKHTDN